jgi:hypothetical protein
MTCTAWAWSANALRNAWSKPTPPSGLPACASTRAGAQASGAKLFFADEAHF